MPVGTRRDSAYYAGRCPGCFKLPHGQSIARVERPRAGRSSPRLRGDVRAPAAVRADLALALDEERLADDTQHLLAIRELDLADAEARRLLQQDLGQALWRYR